MARKKYVKKSWFKSLMLLALFMICIGAAFVLGGDNPEDAKKIREFTEERVEQVIEKADETLKEHREE